MDKTKFLESAQFVTGEASDQATNPNAVPAPPGSPEMELLGWQSNSSFMDNLLLAANEVPPAVAADLPQPPPELLVPAPEQFPVPELQLLPPPAPAGEAEAEEAAVNDEIMRPAHQLLAGQAISESSKVDDKGKRALLAEPLPQLPEFTIPDIHSETCIVCYRMKQMSFTAWADETGLMTEMPKVTTTGDGPFGKRIEGFAFQIEKGGDVGTMCFCHGHFFSPAEFIKHAGGKPAPNPLKQIQVFFPSADHIVFKSS